MPVHPETWVPRYSAPFPQSKSEERFAWTKSGTNSRVYDTPYEIYEKRYVPVEVTSSNAGKLGFAIEAEILALISKRRDKKTQIRPDHLIQCSMTCVVDKEVKTSKAALEAYREGKYQTTRHTQRYQVREIRNALIPDMIDRFYEFADMPSKPAWLCIVQLTIRLDDGEEGLIFKGRLSIHKIWDTSVGSYALV